MSFLPDVIACVLLLLIFLQDWQTRFVNIWLFVSLFVCLLTSAWVRQVFSPWVFVINLSFLSVLLLILVLYTRWRWAAEAKHLLEVMGVGDIVCWLVTAVYFSFYGFVAFFLGSLLFALISHLFIKTLEQRLFLKKKLPETVAPETVALAGWQSLFLVFTIIFRYLFPGFYAQFENLFLEVSL